MTADITRTRGRWIFVAACALSVAAVLVYVALTSWRSPGGQPAESASSHSGFLDAVPTGSLILFRDGSPGDLYGRLAIVRLPIGDQPRQIAPLSCERVHYAAGWGVCMVTDESRMPVRYSAYVFDRSFVKGPDIALTGPPIRARISPDGRRAALTVFERGHSYADEEFSTRTIVVDTASGRQIADLEDFVVEKDGRPFKSVDFNFWGVTFARDGDQFFATLKTKGQRYLVKGSVDARRVAVIRGDVECPSLSPNGSLIVFKKPLEHEIGWRLHVLDLATGVERPLNQTRRSVDDQVDWFDDTHVVYHDSASEGTGIWVLSVDGVTPPKLLLTNAYSPAVQR
jgi:dipeptidyl aminopeptidase/acylaminoacyl peptidase